MKFNELSKDLQKEIKEVLKAYSECNLIFENGQYNVTTGILLKKEYASDHKFMGTYYSKDIFSSEEKIINYIECFLEYPPNYKGERNYNMLNNMQNLRQEGKQAKIILIDGNALIDRIEEI